MKKIPRVMLRSKADKKVVGDVPVAKPEVTTARDIVSGEEVKISRAKAEGLTSFYEGKTYYFANYTSNHEFDKNPEVYVKKAGSGVQTHPQPEMTKDPVCGMPVETAKAKQAGTTRDYQGKSYYFCSDTCLKKFNKTPERFLAKPEVSPPQHEHMANHAKPQPPAGMVKDPVCGLMVGMESAKQAGYFSQYGGKTYYFDTEGCKQRFERFPQRYLAGSEEVPFPEKYPNVPTDPNQMLQLRRDFHRSISPWKSQDLFPPNSGRDKVPGA